MILVCCINRPQEVKKDVFSTNFTNLLFRNSNNQDFEINCVALTRQKSALHYDPRIRTGLTSGQSLFKRLEKSLICIKLCRNGPKQDLYKSCIRCFSFELLFLCWCAVKPKPNSNPNSYISRPQEPITVFHSANLKKIFSKTLQLWQVVLYHRNILTYGPLVRIGHVLGRVVFNRLIIGSL